MVDILLFLSPANQGPIAKGLGSVTLQVLVRDFSCLCKGHHYPQIPYCAYSRDPVETRVEFCDQEGREGTREGSELRSGDPPDFFLSQMG